MKPKGEAFAAFFVERRETPRRELLRESATAEVTEKRRQNRGGVDPKAVIG